MAGKMFGEIKNFFNGIKASESVKDALKLYNATIQFRIVEKFPAGIPSDFFFKTDGEWYYIDVNDGELSFGEGDVRKKRDWKSCILVQVEREVLESIFEGKLGPKDAVYSDRMHVGNALNGAANAWWVTTLLRLGQVRDNYQNYMHSGRKKSYMTLWQNIKREY